MHLDQFKYVRQILVDKSHSRTLKNYRSVLRKNTSKVPAAQQAAFVVLDCLTSTGHYGRS